MPLWTNRQSRLSQKEKSLRSSRSRGTNPQLGEYMNEKELDVLSSLYKLNIVPTRGIFQVTESMLQEYINFYHMLYGRTNNATGTKSNKKFARRLAGRTLVQLNALRGASYRSIKSGLIYLIENPAFSEYYKIGITVDIETRLSQYQTYDPHRAYKVSKYDFVLDKSLAEKFVIKNKTNEDGLGEWLLKPNGLKLFNEVIAQ